MRIEIDESRRRQVFNGFGASGAWWAQIVGNWTHEDSDGISVRDKISRLLFSKKDGIGLKIYRYNIGGGSLHSGKGTYSMPARRTECFETAPRVYDWSRDSAAVYMMKRAVSDGADEVVFFVNSPIERLTKNNMAHLGKHSYFRENIKEENYTAFANYCLDVTEHFVSEGIPVKYISPVNEPLWIWNGGQEGCHYKPKSCRKVFRTFASELEKRNSLADVKLSGCESGDIRWFNKSYARSILGSPEIRRHLDALDVHSYFLHAPLPFMNNRPAFLRRFASWMSEKYPDVPVNMSEWTHMQGGRDKSMASALVMAKVMFEDISILNVVSWQHWIAASEVDYCDGLIYLNLEDKSYEMTKRYYVTGNFSKYIPCGATRIEACCDDNDIAVLAFEYGGEYTLIVINDTCDSKELTLPVGKSAQKYIVTDENDNLAEYLSNDERKIKITPHSVTTVILSA